jgi:hypothetical protein
LASLFVLEKATKNRACVSEFQIKRKTLENDCINFYEKKYRKFKENSSTLRRLK